MSCRIRLDIEENNQGRLNVSGGDGARLGADQSADARLAVAGVNRARLRVEGDETVRLGASQGRDTMDYDYNSLRNKPSIEGVTLQGDKTFPQLGLDIISNQDIDKIIFGE